MRTWWDVATSQTEDALGINRIDCLEGKPAKGTFRGLGGWMNLEFQVTNTGLKQ